MAEQSKSDPLGYRRTTRDQKEPRTFIRIRTSREIEAIGTPFDPNIHDSISLSYRDDLPERTVTKEIRKGYMINDKILRPSLVEVSKKIIKNIDNDRENMEKESE